MLRRRHTSSRRSLCLESAWTNYCKGLLHVGKGERRVRSLNIRDLSKWSQKLSEDYAGEYPGAPVLNKTQSLGFNRRFVIALPRHPLRGPHSRSLGRSGLCTLDGERYPQRTAHHGHGEDYPTYQAKGDGVLLTEVRDGEIVREGWYWDQLSLLDQLGIIEHPGLFLSSEGF